jgi:hypothetical protein
MHYIANLTGEYDKLVHHLSIGMYFVNILEGVREIFGSKSRRVVSSLNIQTEVTHERAMHTAHIKQATFSVHCGLTVLVLE